MTEITWTLRTDRQGQPRPYADSEQVGVLTLSGDWYGKPADFSRSVVKRALQGLSYYGFQYERDDERPWHVGYLDYLEKIERGRWKYRIVLPYTD